ncbi:AMIN-like domain-containing (lipo)protein [Blastococcus sp. PRF04-17]|uniref:AMIN-like domain-containing (lipo)protein n=1 Tax=Blastococcus sp. PRF04-17 TaxID=2933797 RepID=UPI001FF60A46|nr:hypothetical protein [Blastococcus sp. PRF04-17]UOX99740.1 hypothetical protein MVA48_11810 [Blastococcus sp. PRF04-17]
MSRTPLRLLVLALAAALAAVVLPATAQAAPYCGITWGSGAKQAGSSAPAIRGTELTAVRAGQHACYDRLVLDITGSTRVASYRVEYVPAVRADGSGAVIPLRGGAFLQITVGVNNYARPPANSGNVADVSGFRTFRQVAGAGSFEGYTSEGLGVRARLPFRVFTISGPGSTVRVVLDVAHAW